MCSQLSQPWPIFSIEASLQTPNLSDLDWMMEAHEYFGDDKFFSLLDKWLSKHDSSALFEMLYVSILKDHELLILQALERRF